ncbi:MAG TPA: hypothetical protein VKV25_03205, partial [Acidimicrobiales bacterium]|nr:hypothetical protein [Acidimicrobiales bacterium]
MSDRPSPGPVVVAVDLGGTKTAVAVADLSGRRLARTTMPTGAAGAPAANPDGPSADGPAADGPAAAGPAAAGPAAAGPAAVMARIGSAGRSLLVDAGGDLDAVAAVAAVTP